ncbi:MAG TPA: Uma2 family endonuclease [Gemmataceae bacterium]|nr:Uma2 family endonuclease [Gemmataceae bacterium]
MVVPVTAMNLAGFRAWATSPAFPERGRISFIKDEIFIDMSREELETHNQVKVEINRVLANWNKRHRRGELYSHGALMSNTVAGLSTEPDATFASWEALQQRRARLVPQEGMDGECLEIEGTPDWVLEVVSDPSVVKDTRRLRRAYYQAGIPEYWLVDARGKEVDFQMLVRGKTAYEPAIATGGWQHSPVFRQRFRLVRRRLPLGLWNYTLATRPLPRR